MPVGSLLALSAAALSPVGPSGLCKAGSFLSFANLSSRLAALGPAILWTLDPPWPCASTPPPSCSSLKPEFQRRLITMMIKVATVARSPKATWPGHAALAASSVLRALARAPMGPGLSSCSPPVVPVTSVRTSSLTQADAPPLRLPHAATRAALRPPPCCL